jgi:hypothetical protein
MRKSVLAVLVLATCSFLAAQQVMNNDSVIKLVKAGLSDDLIVTTINSSPGAYDTSADAIIALKSAGASDKVIAAIIAKVAAPPSSPAQPAPSTASAGTNPDDPNAPHEAGIYFYIFYIANSGGPKMTELEPSDYSQGKTGGMFASAMTYGIAKAKTKAVLRGAHANARVSDPNADFYFYFEQQAAGLSQASSPFGGTSTPNEYTLLKFDVKSDTRETVVGKFNAYGASGGVDDKAVVPFTYEKLRPGVYKVTLKSPLVPGEYGFISNGGTVVAGPYAATTNSRVFDFGVN